MNPGICMTAALVAGLASAAARADCAADFERDNRIKPESGPFLVETDTLLPVAQTQVVKVVPPQAIHQTMRVQGLTMENIRIGTKGWSRDGDGPWRATEVFRGDEAYTAYDTLRKNNEPVECSTPAKGLGKPTRSYTYTYTASSGPLTITNVFDAESGLPKKTAATDAQGRQMMEVRYRFDRSIRIAPPKP